MSETPPRLGPKPTLAIALRHDPGDDAPVVVASGRGAIGQQIIDLAARHGVPLDHNPVLAEALSTIELDTEIPEQLFKAVAEVLGFILRTSTDPIARRPPVS